MLEVTGLEVAARGGSLLTGVSLKLAEGGSLALVGESGSGKTTLLRACMGLLAPGLRVGGSVRWRGRELLQQRPAQWRRLRRQELAWIPQEPSAALDPRSSAAAHLGEGLSGDAAVHAATLWAEVGLGLARRRAYPHEWSGGMQQRLLVAMALARQPRLLCADEPTSALDTLHQAQLLALLARLRCEHGFALLLVTHDLAVAAQAAEHILVLRQGGVVEQGPTAEVLAHPHCDYTAALIACQPAWRAREVGA
ncbi:MAG: ATP-binding cassette domain-containing protein [Terriglobales bacterium]